MQSLEGRNGRSSDLRLALERLDGLPVRPVSARGILGLIESDSEEVEVLQDSRSTLRFLGHDPGVVVGRGRGDRDSLIKVVADHPWWRSNSVQVQDALENLWRHAVATSISARRLAVEAGRDDAEDLAEAGLLNQLGYWAVASLDPDQLIAWLAIRSRTERRASERLALGSEATTLGGRLAQRWGLSPLVVASAWLHADRGSDLHTLCDDPEGLEILQKAYLWAEQTPWALLPSSMLDPGPGDPRLKILVAEVQVRCSAGLLDPEATHREESVSRSYARLAVRERSQARVLDSHERFLRTLTEGEAMESPRSWGDRVARSWCEDPSVTSAQVVWRGEDQPSFKSKTLDELPVRRAPSLVLPLGQGSPASELRLWTFEPDGADLPITQLMATAWGVWADQISIRERQSRLLDDVMTAHRSRRDERLDEENGLRLEALAEFAAGAGHELNNPLAVILGRAQLLIPRMDDPEATRSLKIIIGQAQRAHRILRDLMYVARPPQPRPRPCQPDEILRASVRDFKAEADARGIRLVAETLTPVPVAWADPDPLRHLADVLIRNALESTPVGGTIRVSSERTENQLRWTIRDNGRGINSEDAVHLFDPFYCGRQAGRGLGLGLSRIARYTNQVGGHIAWKSRPGEETIFRVDLPILAATGTG